jgi:hypothetical protein
VRTATAMTCALGEVYAKFMRGRKQLRNLSGDACPICRRGEMEQLNYIVQDDQSITIYWRCPICSHVQVTRTEAALDRNREPKLGGPGP